VTRPQTATSLEAKTTIPERMAQRGRLRCAHGHRRTSLPGRAGLRSRIRCPAWKGGCGQARRRVAGRNPDAARRARRVQLHPLSERMIVTGLEAPTKAGGCNTVSLRHFRARWWRKVRVDAVTRRKALARCERAPH